MKDHYLPGPALRYAAEDRHRTYALLEAFKDSA